MPLSTKMAEIFIFNTCTLVFVYFRTDLILIAATHTFDEYTSITSTILVEEVLGVDDILELELSSLGHGWELDVGVAHDEGFSCVFENRTRI